MVVGLADPIVRIHVLYCTVLDVALDKMYGWMDGRPACRILKHRVELGHGYESSVKCEWHWRTGNMLDQGRLGLSGLSCLGLFPFSFLFVASRSFVFMRGREGDSLGTH